MAFDVKDLTVTTQDQFFATLENIQDAVLEGVRLWNGAVKSVVPNELAEKVESLPGVKHLPSPATYVALQFDFAEKLLSQQRTFFEQLVADTAPAAPASPLVTVSNGQAKSAAAAAR